jgi:hypothetical protein
MHTITFAQFFFDNRYRPCIGPNKRTKCECGCAQCAT